MVASHVRKLAFSALIAGLASVGTGCYVEEGPPPPEPVYAEGYAPQYYDGYVVYYDDVGRPYYYVNGAVVWVAPTSPFYAGYVHHYRVYGPAYHHWYVNHGYRYRAYRGRRRYR